MNLSLTRSHIPIPRPEKRPKSKGKRIRSAKPHRAAQLRIYTKSRKVFLSSHPYCQVWIKEHGLTEKEVIDNNGRVEWNCGFDLKIINAPLATDIHHIWGRIGNLLLDESHWLAVCRPMHDKIHANPSWARENGYLK